MQRVLTIILIIASALFIFVLARITVRRARALSERIDEYRAEQDAQSSEPGPINPYADMGKAFGGEDSTDSEREEK